MTKRIQTYGYSLGTQSRFEWIWFFQIGFSATDSVMALKLVEAGIPSENLGLITVPLIPVQIALPLVIAKYTTGNKYFLVVICSGRTAISEYIWNFFINIISV